MAIAKIRGKDKNTEQKLANRVHLLDEIRGVAIILMVIYHTFFNLVYMYKMNIPLFHTPFMQGTVTFVVFIFVSISGSACAFSRSNLRRGIKCLALGLVMTVVTYFAVPDLLIVFGILHMLGVCMIAYGLTSKLLSRIPPVIMIISGIALYILTYNVTNGYIGVKGVFELTLPRVLYDVGFLFPFGFTGIGFRSSDYFALFPWLFCFLAGSGFGELLKQRKLPRIFYTCHSRALCFVGRNTIWIYLLHQPIIYGVMLLILNIIKG